MKQQSMMLAVAIFCTATITAAAQDTAKGMVFHDKNGNGQFEEGEPGVAQVAVSNGRDVVRTGDDGRYTIPVSGDTIVFIAKPAGWQVPIEAPEYLPRFYYVHRPNGSPNLKFKGVEATGPLPASIDFPLTPVEEPDQFKMICLGDTQPRDQQEIDYIAHQVVEELAGVDSVMGVTLGDLVFDNLAIYEPLTQALGLLQRPWYHVIGNHDTNYDTPDQKLSAETYARIFGPSYYAFNYGKVHFIAINDIFWEVPNQKYHGEIGEDQLAFIQNYLKDVPKDHLIVPMMHIPLNDVEDRAKLFDILAEFPHVLALAAHWHRQEHFFMGADMGWHGAEPLHHVVHATACGSWWTGNFDPLGIPVATMSDGTPIGYSIIEFNGPEYEMTYKVAKRPADYQMNIHAPDAVARGEAANVQVHVNVFAGNEKSTVEMKFGEAGEWCAMTQTRAFDPFYTAVSDRQWALITEIAKRAGVENPDEDILRQWANDFRPFLGRTQPEPRETGHIWTAPLPADLALGYHFIHVRTTDMFGHVYTDRRAIRVIE